MYACISLHVTAVFMENIQFCYILSSSISNWLPITGFHFYSPHQKLYAKILNISLLFIKGTKCTDGNTNGNMSMFGNLPCTLCNGAGELSCMICFGITKGRSCDAKVVKGKLVL